MSKTTASLSGVSGLERRLKAGTVINGRYRIEKKLGEGGGGIVFRVTDTLLKTQLALKFLNPVLTADERKFLRVKREINLSRKIADKRIVKVFSLERWDSLHFLVMEYVAGRSLKNILQEKKSFKWEDFKNIYFEILAGIEVLHKHNIIHRDLKPSNIIVTGSNGVKILDFGLAKEVSDKEKTSSFGELVGSPYYMSPEQASGKEVDFSSDIYSSGMILYRALAGRHPFQDAATMEVIFKQIHTRPVKIALKSGKIPKFVQFAIEKALEKKKDRRFSSIGEMLQFLKKGKAPLLYWLRLEFLSKPLRIALLCLFAGALLFFAYFKIVIAKRVYYVETKGSVLIARNNRGKELWKKNFIPFTIQAVLEPERPVTERDKILRVHKSILVFLKHPMNKSFSPQVSLFSGELDSRTVHLDAGGNEIFKRSFIEAAGIETYDFAKITQIEDINDDISRVDIDNDGREEIIFMVRQSRGMYPSALCIFNEGELFSYSNPGGIDNYEFLQVDKKDMIFYVFGFNNILAHSMFFSEIHFSSKIRKKIAGMPNFDRDNNPVGLYRYLVVLPKGTDMVDSYENHWKDKGIISFRNNRTTGDIDWYKTYTLMVSGVKYKCHPADLGKVYILINKYFREKMNKNPGEAYAIISKALEHNVVNPFLKSALLYFKGDLEVLFGEYEKGEATLYEALKLYPGSSDVAHRICEIEFLKGNPQKAIEIVDKEFSRARILADMELDRAKFYLEDILEFSKTRDHQAQVSACYLKAKEGNTAGAEALAKPAFENVLKLAKGDFDTRLWLFYDAYIYGKTMAICGNKEEARRGYRVCIQANPYTDLSKRSAAALQRLQNE